MFHLEGGHQQKADASERHDSKSNFADHCSLRVSGPRQNSDGHLNAKWPECELPGLRWDQTQTNSARSGHRRDGQLLHTLGMKSRKTVTAMLLMGAILSHGTPALAGDTGTLIGLAVDADTSARVAGATVTVSASAPSESARITTDAVGLFTFLALSPDIYTVTVRKSGYKTVTLPGQIVFSDRGLTLTVRLVKIAKPANACVLTNVFASHECRGT